MRPLFQKKKVYCSWFVFRFVANYPVNSFISVFIYQMDTPRDASCTHILVVPTSATAQANNQAMSSSHLDMPGGELGEDEEDFLTGMMGGDGMDDIDMMGGDISDILGGLIDQHDPLGATLDQAAAVGGGGPIEVGVGGRHSPLGRNKMPLSDPQDDNPNLLQQPLAMGFYMSTAKTGLLPKWFWAACPHRENISPTCLKVRTAIGKLSYIRWNGISNSNCSRQYIYILLQLF